MRKPYILKTEEVDTLLAGLVSHGADATYERMRDKAFDASQQRPDMDDVFLDMYEGMIKKARGIDAGEEDGKKLSNDLYTLATMMRNIAHQLYRAYNRAGMIRDNDRFLRLVVSNDTIPAE